jgi:flagellar protein FliO/FliZ
MLLAGGSDIAQLLTVLVIFVLVLGATAWVTKWLADFQKTQNAGRNIQIVETTRIANNKFVQILKIGDTYKVVGVGKDTVTYLGDVSGESLKTSEETVTKDTAFRSMYEKALQKLKNSSDGEKDKDS